MPTTFKMTTAKYVTLKYVWVNGKNYSDNHTELTVSANQIKRMLTSHQIHKETNISLGNISSCACRLSSLEYGRR